MDFNRRVKLIKQTISFGNLREEIMTETYTEVYAQVTSITQTEWFSAGKNGIQAQYKATVYSFEYNNEPIVEIDGQRLSVYRTYNVPKQDLIELYLETKGGTE